MNPGSHTIDAGGKMLGRVATEAVLLLRGKNTPDFLPYKEPATKVIITNVAKIKISGNKDTQKEYKRFSGYPGGLKYISYTNMFAQNPSLVLQKAIRGMLPKNKLRQVMLRNLTIHNGGANE